ncbi:aldolase/citrate lyase family protein [Nitrosomonas ureae]|uniref:HpcH/HpaI aldolase/citrate lyase family protein n=1 Tax=Nitrosomonas ureae TaxID=44577 RepID=A0A1H5UTQ6_9PROT|nr:aldolase/citrate lyase family protein [Nitrosomonas ureae]SEF77818.1 HpcH/HpaI aldolase/citrate lyase family protein [Nitrosomonas ureae]
MSYGSDFVLTLFTNDPDLARAGNAAGINRIGLDLERMGKEHRQDAKKAWISDHQMHELEAIRDQLTQSALFARINPIHAGSRNEINSLIDQGVTVLMLPMFRTLNEAATFIELVDGRAFVSLLVETAAAAIRLREIVKLPGIGEIHFGLNDMYLDMKLSNHFEVLTSGFLDRLTDIASEAGIPYGFAGIGRLNDSRLPIPSDLIYAQYPRLGATRALVARVFYTPDFRALDLTYEVNTARAKLDQWHQAGMDQQTAALTLLRTKVTEWAV